MSKKGRKVFMTAGHATVSLGTGRKEFNPKKPRPGVEDYVREAGQGTLKQIGGGKNVDEGVIANFMAARFNKQGHLAALIPYVDPDLRWKPCVRVEGACGSGGLGLMTAIKSVLAETAEVVLTIGVEVQNTVKAVYGADILAGAGWYRGERKNGHAYFFPALFATGPAPISRNSAATRRARPSPAGIGTPSKTPACATLPRSSTMPAPTSKRWP
jgi:acetyl-CoA C-acetyltransferase/acetyl-CoA acyltransferase